MKRSLLFTIVLLLVVCSAFSAQSAKASAAMTSYTLTCSSFTASGTTNSPYGGLEVITPTDAVFAGFPASGGSFSGTINFPAVPEGTLITIYVYGAVDSAGYWDNQPYFVADVACKDAISGPPIPAGFVQKTVTCNVAVYDAPGGKPVGSNTIRSGQTWYVNPTPKKDAAGKSWTEIFVAGYTNGYVPTSCVH
jgi:hypothetical protein